jgi:hypothetical protein
LLLEDFWKNSPKKCCHLVVPIFIQTIDSKLNKAHDEKSNVLFPLTNNEYLAIQNVFLIVVL